MAEIKERILRVQQKFSDQINNQQNKKGVLTQELIDYFRCLFDTDALQKLYEKDEKFWKENLKKTQNRFSSMTENLQVFFKEQEKKL